MAAITLGMLGRPSVSEVTYVVHVENLMAALEKKNSESKFEISMRRETTACCNECAANGANDAAAAAMTGRAIHDDPREQDKKKIIRGNDRDFGMICV